MSSRRTWTDWADIASHLLLAFAFLVAVGVVVWAQVSR